MSDSIQNYNEFLHSNGLLDFSTENKRILELLYSWYIFVEKSRSGYPLTLNDYHMELYQRDELESSIDKLASHALKQRIVYGLEKIDVVFKKLLVDTSSSVLPSDKHLPKSKYWWWYGVPKIVGEEMAHDLEDHLEFKSYKTKK